MTDTQVTKGPAKTAAERQAQRRARIQAHAERGANAIYQVRSFESLLQTAADLGIPWAQSLAMLAPSGTLEEINVTLNMEVMRERMVRRNEALDGRPKATANVTHDAPKTGTGSTVQEALAAPVDSATVAPSKVSAKPRASRKRVGK